MKQLLLTLFLSLTFYSISQTNGVAFSTVGKGVATPFVTDYQCLGINVSGLGWGTGYAGTRFTVGALESSFGVYSESLNATKVKNLTTQLLQASKGGTIDYQRQLNAVADYQQAGIGVYADINWAGFSFQTQKFGGIAFNIRENYQYYSQMNQQTTDLLFRGKTSGLFDSLVVAFGSDTSVIRNRNNISPDTLAAVVLGKLDVPARISQITYGSQIRMSWTRSYNVGYGRKIFGDSTFALYGGVGARLISSMAYFNLVSDDSGLSMTSSITPNFNIAYGTTAGTNPGTSKGGIPPSVGTGYGVDLALSAMLFKKIRIAAAINNVGSVRYKQNVYTVQDTLISSISLDGINSGNITYSVNQLLRENGILKLQGQKTFIVSNPADFRFGAAYDSKRFKIGFDFVAPFNPDAPGSLVNAIVSVGGEVRPVKWLAINAGYYGGGVYKNNIPLGLTFILKNGRYEAGVASRDVLGFITKNAHTVSAALCFARFRF